MNRSNEGEDKPKIVGADIGYSFTKIADESYLWADSSILGEPRPLFDPHDPTDFRYFGDVDGTTKELFVGGLALRESKMTYKSIGDNKLKSWETMILLKCGLGWLNPVSPVNLVTGLPVDFYNKQKDEFALMLRDFNDGLPYNVSMGFIDKKGLKPKIKNNAVVPQPLGSLMDYLLDADGKIANEADYVRDILVIDLGFYTLDLLIWTGRRIGQDSVTPPGLGISRAYQLIQEEIKKQLGRNPSVYEIDRVSRETNFIWQEFNIRPFYDVAMRSLGTQIDAEVRQLNRDFYKYVITGGRAPEVAKYIQVPEDKKIIGSWRSNVDGYIKFGKKLWGC